MNCTVTHTLYRNTGFYTKLITDYLDEAITVKPFYAHAPSLAGIKAAIGERLKFNTNRALLVQQLQLQYNGVSTANKVTDNISLLLQENTFTVTTAHQPNIFTGYLYFIYKIIHTIKLADELKVAMPENNFVPVYYMGSEDADLDELGKINLFGEKLVWKTVQTGAVGRMKVDKDFMKMVDKIAGTIGVEKYGNETIALLRQCYKEGEEIQQATFKLVNALFAEYGLIVLLPDNAALKSSMEKIFKDDLLHQTASVFVEATIAEIEKNYKVQAHPRSINLFYLKDDIRERIEVVKDGYVVVNTNLYFTKEALLQELREHAERFSPNVILRGVYQEMILPNIAFIGGGGELAYWLELKTVFEHYKVPYPVLLLRNSFWVLEEKWQEKINKLGFEATDFFKPSQKLLDELVKRDAATQMHLTNEIRDTKLFYEHLKIVAANVDVTLVPHTITLQTKTVKLLEGLEKKMLRAEKRKFGEQSAAIEKIKAVHFPGNGLQERYDNFIPYYARWQKGFLELMYENAQPIGDNFITISIED